MYIISQIGFYVFKSNSILQEKKVHYFWEPGPCHLHWGMSYLIALWVIPNIVMRVFWMNFEFSTPCMWILRMHTKAWKVRATDYYWKAWTVKLLWFKSVCHTIKLLNIRLLAICSLSSLIRTAIHNIDTSIFVYPSRTVSMSKLGEKIVYFVYLTRTPLSQHLR